MTSRNGALFGLPAGWAISLVAWIVLGATPSGQGAEDVVLAVSERSRGARQIRPGSSIAIVLDESLGLPDSVFEVIAPRAAVSLEELGFVIDKLSDARFVLTFGTSSSRLRRCAVSSSGLGIITDAVQGVRFTYRDPRFGTPRELDLLLRLPDGQSCWGFGLARLVESAKCTPGCEVEFSVHLATAGLFDAKRIREHRKPRTVWDGIAALTDSRGGDGERGNEMTTALAVRLIEAALRDFPEAGTRLVSE